MKNLKVFLVIVAIIVGTILIFHYVKVAPEQNLPTSNNQLTLEMKQKVYSSDAKEITANIIAHEENLSGAYYITLEKKRFGFWYKVPLENDAVDAIEVSFSTTDPVPIVLKIDDLKSELTSGEYRAVYGTIAAPFTVQ